MKKIYTLYFFLNDNITIQEFNNFEDMNLFIINYDVEVFKYTKGIKVNEKENIIIYESSISSKYE